MLEFIGKVLLFLFRSLLIVYAGAILLWFLLWFLTADAFWWMMAINRAAPLLFLPIPLLGLISLPLRDKFSYFTLAVPTALFLYLYAPYLIPKLPVQAQPETAVSLMTYNLKYDNRSYDAIAALIQTQQPDFVALQEVQPDAMAALEQRLADLYPYTQMGSQNAYGTTAVLSQHPIEESNILDLEIDRPATIIHTTVQGQPITVVSVHLQAYGLHWFSPEAYPDIIPQRTTEQNREAANLVRYLAAQEGVILLGCDCNSTETNSSYRILARQLRNAAHTAGWSLRSSLPSQTKIDRRLTRVDHILYKGSLQPTAVFIPNSSGGSDHLPIIATFALP